MHRLLALLFAGALACAHAQDGVPAAPPAAAPLQQTGNTGLDPAVVARIKAMPHGTRPDPSTYLAPAYMAAHLAQFDHGACRFSVDAKVRKYGVGQQDGTSFVMPCNAAEQLVQSSAVTRPTLEAALGLPAHTLDGDLILIKIARPRALGLRLPSGNEAGANAAWIPGGKLPDGSLEAVVTITAVLARKFEVIPIPLQQDRPR